MFRQSKNRGAPKQKDIMEILVLKNRSLACRVDDEVRTNNENNYLKIFE